ncbi:hypothetical protein [Methanosarcina acetivorans]|nr:hypothetical protein [Methanosarcina acetivorans]
MQCRKEKLKPKCTGTGKKKEDAGPDFRNSVKQLSVDNLTI